MNVETVEVEKSSKFTRPIPGTVFQGQLPYILDVIKKLPPANPVAFEISRAIRKIEKLGAEVDEPKFQIMSKFLLRDEDGNWVPTKQAKNAIKIAAATGQSLTPNEFGYEIEGGDDTKQEYFVEISNFLNTSIQLDLVSIDASSKSVKSSEGQIVKLIDCLSEYFDVNQIMFLEDIGILSGLE